MRVLLIAMFLAAALAGCGHDPADAAPVTQAPPERAKTIGDIIDDDDAAVKAEARHHDDVGRQLIAQRTEAVKAWLLRADLSDLRRIPLSNPPQEGELIADQIMVHGNEYLAKLRQARDARGGPDGRMANVLIEEMRSSSYIKLIMDR